MCYIMFLFNLYGTSDSRWNRFWTSKSITVNLVSSILLEERLLYILIFCTLKRYKNIYIFFVTAAGQDVIIKYQRCSYIIPSPLSKRFCINFGVEIFKRMIDYNILYFYIRKNYNIYTYICRLMWVHVENWEEYVFFWFNLRLIYFLFVG